MQQMYLTHIKDELWAVQMSTMRKESLHTQHSLYISVLSIDKRIASPFQGLSKEKTSHWHISAATRMRLSFITVCLQIWGLQAQRDFKQTGKSRWVSHAEVNELHYLCSAELAESFFVLWSQTAKNLSKNKIQKLKYWKTNSISHPSVRL